MVLITTWPTFLTYGLDLMTRDEITAAVFILAGQDVRYDARVYRDKQFCLTKLLWTDDVEEALKNPKKYWEELENMSANPGAGIGKIMGGTIALPTILFVPNTPRNTVLVHVLQKFLFETWGIGSVWLDGAIYEHDGNYYEQDDEKVKKAYKDHLKHAAKNLQSSRMLPGKLHRDTRLNYLNKGMSESDMRKYLSEHYGKDTTGMDASMVYTMMKDLFVDEADGTPDVDNTKDVIRGNYKIKKKKRKRR